MERQIAKIDADIIATNQVIHHLIYEKNCVGQRVNMTSFRTK